MESNMDVGNCPLPGLTTMDFSTVDPISSSGGNTGNMETQDSTEVVTDIPVAEVAQTLDFESDLFVGLKWKFDTVVKDIDGAPFVFNALLPYDIHGNPVLITFQRPEEQYSESGQSSSHHVGHQEEIEIMQDQNKEVSIDENIMAKNIVTKTEFESAVTSILVDENPIADMGKGNNATTTEDQNVAPPPAVDISSGASGGIGVDSPDEHNENDQRPHTHTSSEHQETTPKCNPHIFKDGKFVPNYNHRNSRADRTYSPQKFNNLGVPISPIIEDGEGPRRRYICQFCRIAYPQLYKWKKHVRIHIDEVVTTCTCPKCGIPYQDSRTARKHHNAAYPD